MQVPKTLTPADIAAIEKEIGSTREEREKHAMDMALNAGLRGSLMVGGAGVVGHMLAQKFWPWYKTGIYVQGKAFIVSSMFVAGYWIWSESTMTQQMRFLNNLESVKQDMADAETYDRLGQALPGKR